MKPRIYGKKEIQADGIVCICGCVIFLSTPELSPTWVSFFFARVDKDYRKLEISVNGNNTATMERVS